jgi:hypothetical protein
VRIAVVGDWIDHPDNITTNTADLTVTEGIFTSPLSTPCTVYTIMDVKTYHLGILMSCFKYMTITVRHILKCTMIENNMYEVVHDGYIYIETHMSMYGVPQLGLRANILLAN